MDLATPISQVPRVGPVLEKRLKGLGIFNLGDLLGYYPQKYEDFSRFEKIINLKPRQNAAIRGKVLEIKNSLAWKKRMTLTQAIVSDDSGAIKIVWFGKPYITDTLFKNDQVVMAGQTSLGKNGLYFNNPSYEKITENSSPYRSRIAGLMPIYQETKGLPSKWLRNLIRPLLAVYKKEVRDFLPAETIRQFKLMSKSQAVWQIHFPDSLDLAQKAKNRLSFEELFLIELFVLKQRIKILQTKANSVSINLALIKKFVKSLPFKLTDAQRKSAWQILKDMEKNHPMNRLLEGEVGSGKTVVATIAALNTAKAGFQTAIMAATEILAKQHFKEISKMLFDFKLTIALLTGKEDKIMAKKLKGEILEASRQKILQKCLSNEIDILIGTHSLIQKSVRFGNLALVVIDEQHRFGIEQRAKLIARGNKAGQKRGINAETKVPHLLTMTATPIPRSLALTIYGDLDLSVIDQLPKGRKKIITKVATPEQKNNIYEFIRRQIESGRQAFVICPRIENVKHRTYNMKHRNTAWNDVKAVKEEKQRLETDVFPNLKVEILHGRMTPKEKEGVMKSFKNNKINILVSTSVVEVGIDIPNASVMVIEGADRFGLAQLHQLRGRVGRSFHQSYCFLVTESSNRKTKARLEAMVKSQDGFELSQMDLEIRGPGQISGRKQWGLPDLAMASLKNLEMVQATKESAKQILEKDINLKNYPPLKERLAEFEKKVHLE